MTFNSNDNMYPGSSSDAGNKTKLNQLDAKVNALQQTVTTIADGLASLGTSVNTNSVTAVVGEIGTVTSDTINADVVESEEATFGTVSSDSVEADNVNAETVNAETLNAETIDAGSASVDSLNVADNLGVVHSITAESVTAENAEITDTITANEVDSSSVVTEALEVTGTSTIRGDVTFPEDGDEIIGEDLVIHNRSSYVKDLITEEPSDTNNLVGYDLDGKLIPVDGSLDPSNLWRKVDEETIETKEERIISVPGVVAKNLTTDEPVKSLKHLTYDENGKIIPSEIKLSSQPNNAIVENNDGLYAPQLLISEEEGQAIESKADGIFVQKNTAGENVEISDDGVISATDTTYTAGNNITISDDNEISCDISTMNFRGSVQTVADLPSTDNVIGDVWNVIAIATNYCWDGSQFIAIGSSVDVSGLATKTELETTAATLMNKDGSNADIPEGTETVTDDSELIFKTSDGKLKGKSISDIKAECFPVDLTLSKTSENPVQTKAVAWQLAFNRKTPSVEENPFIYLDNEEVYEGISYKLYFYNDVKSTSKTGKVICGISKATAVPLKVAKNGALIDMPSHLINGEYIFIKAHTSIEVFYSTTFNCYIVAGNPEVISYSDSTSGYRIKANGFITQWARKSYVTNPTSNYTVTLPISFSDTNYHGYAMGTENSMTTNTNPAHFYWEPISKSQFKLGRAIPGGNNWCLEGY